MNAHPLVYFGLAVLLAVSVAASAYSDSPKYTRNYVTVKHGSLATMTCQFPWANPVSVMWKRGLLRFWSWEGEDLFISRESIDPGLDGDYHLQIGAEEWIMVYKR